MLLKALFGSSNDRFIKSLQPIVQKIGALEPQLQRLSDEELKGRTQWLRERCQGGETLDQLLVDAFATVREAGRRVLGMRHFDVQLVGGIVLHRGMIAEMKTGEGKTLVCTLAAYLNALAGKGVHVVTVNDYLAARDSAWMGKLHAFLGLTVGCITHGLDDDERQAAYACDITYGTNNELGFDYLRDNMKFARAAMVHRPFHYAIIDEVDSILIDEARTPLIISGPTEDNSDLYNQVDRVMRHVKPEHYDKEEKQRSVSLTEAGVQFVEAELIKAGMMPEASSLYDIHNVSLVHHVNQGLKAHTLFAKDVDYIVKDGKVVIIDEFTGRMMEGRRYSEGLHQALEAKEQVAIQNENQTLAQVTFQNLFRMYPKLSGMTGTAMTEAGEFHDIYKLEVIEIPTNVAVSRKDAQDEIYRTAEEKYRAVVKEIKEAHERGQPMLVGTVSIEKSEYLSKLLKKEKIEHQVLNARYHEQEANIIAQAGRLGGVTIATNMAGRGTDIKLGGSEESEADKQAVIAVGGLYVIGTERHESRRIDNQLRGRSGRQGDPGASKFFLSLEDDLMRIFGSERIDGLLQKLGMKEDEAIFHPWMTKAIERAQQKVEQRNYEIRKNLLKYDDVMNDQRKVIYEQRIELMEAKEVSETVNAMFAEISEHLVSTYIPAHSYAEAWQTADLEKEIFRVYGLHLPILDWAGEEGIADAEISERLNKAIDEMYTAKFARYGEDLMRMAEKRVLLQTLDQLWKDHLLSLDHLRQGIHLRGFGQRDPLSEYKQEAFSLFEQMLHGLRELTVTRLAHLEIHVENPEDLALKSAQKKMVENRGETPPAKPAASDKVGRNDPCPCGSGKKFKHCHGALA
ncbi:MAG: preprotein translocase subunit SecA [Alphaproteobacteria bacterium]|nr:preprotein translocase subunit SecA [Alphaproteobacteria bacterium]